MTALHLLPVLWYSTALAAILYWLDSTAPRRIAWRQRWWLMAAMPLPFIAIELLSPLFAALWWAAILLAGRLPIAASSAVDRSSGGAAPGISMGAAAVAAIVIAVALLMAFRLLPGIVKWELAPGLAINTGKLFAGLWVAAYLLGTARQPLPAFAAWARFGLVLCAAVIGAAALWLMRSGVQWDEQMPVRLAINLLVTCVAEELFFRALLLHWQLRHWPCAIAIVTNALLFAAVHISFDPVFMALAAVAGGLYGLVYWRTGKISAAIAVHFLVNIPLLLTR